MTTVEPAANGYGCHIGRQRLNDQERRIGVLEARWDRIIWLLIATLTTSAATLGMMVLGK